MDSLIDEALETLTLIFMDLVRTTRDLPPPELTGDAMIQRAKLVTSVIAVGVTLRRLVLRTAKTRAALQPVVDKVNTVQAKVRAEQAKG
jgi:hypothetical protein